ncbi:hypothetical protein C5689_12050 [Methylosinus sporium]|uniref:Uncharacterized protein n=1 Tax=Methylosinus sporium TaxID=428 RepID=A0A2U1SPR1_METSR|nr:hypothetical protein C5689_12050 [Methylosinus sporium]
MSAFRGQAWTNATFYAGRSLAESDRLRNCSGFEVPPTSRWAGAHFQNPAFSPGFFPPAAVARAARLSAFFYD